VTQTHQPEAVQTVYVKEPRNGVATASLVLGIIGAVMAIIPFLGIAGAVVGGIGIALAIVAFFVARKRGVGMVKTIVGFVLGVASIVIFYAVTAATVAAVDSAVKDEAANDKPVAVAEGAAFEHDGFAVAKGWDVTTDELGSPTITGLQVTNNDDTSRSAQLTFTLVKGTENLAEIEASSNELEPGQSSKMDAFSTDNQMPKKWDEIRVADMW
jgi:hypothetical protein